MKIESSIETSKKQLKENLFHSSDFRSTDFLVENRYYCLFYLDTMVDSKLIQEHIVRPLLQKGNGSIKEIVSIIDYHESTRLSDATKSLVEGKTVLQIEGEAKVYLLGTELIKERNVTIPLNETALRGSRSALNENLNTNLNLIRSAIRQPDLVIKTVTLGRRSDTKVSILYLHSLANEVVLMEIEKKIEAIDIDYMDAPGFVQELVDEKRFKLFPKLLVTERPDRICANLMDGRIAVLTDRSPDAIVLPVSFWAFFQSTDDYQMGWLMGSAIRSMRYLCFILAICLPGLYVALVTFDPRVVPFEIALTLQGSTQYVALPPVLEAIAMLLMLEIIREATVRLPNLIGQTIGVVGAIVIGTVVVQSNLISNMMVVIVAVTAISSFMVPTYEMSNATRFLTYPFIFMGSIFGMIGLEVSFLLLAIHLSQIDTFGIPYFYLGFKGSELRDTVFRGPISSLKNRPKETLTNDTTREKEKGGE
ncbi:spore germination protein [Bacillus sp. AFS002410]|uniref:spore germination protein n=1 Tax=Bacillus sp. AFS002410 TaxID=2033481 RepID=UPI000BEFC8DE|nr:spore germination protein [Bacillus sp. AFS002410]PEJ58009.1 spore germination protein [Bacillus sp. AFS002410]